MSPSCFSRQDVHHSVYLLLQKIGIVRPLGTLDQSHLYSRYTLIEKETRQGESM